MGFQLMALGSPVELMEAYEFAALAHMIVTAKRVITSKPIHLFGAGHPLTIPLTIALGCDTFDSASYMLYAKAGRYMMPNGTVRLNELSYLPCQCPVCSSHTLNELRSMQSNGRTIEVAKHNLHILKAEVDAVKQAIMDGRLWEYVVQKARAHPKLMEAVQLFKDLELLETGKGDLFLRSDRPVQARGPALQAHGVRIQIIKKKASALPGGRGPPILFYQKVRRDCQEISRCAGMQLQPLPRRHASRDI
jgi:hypothetical protein